MIIQNPYWSFYKRWHSSPTMPDPIPMSCSLNNSTMPSSFIYHWSAILLTQHGHLLAWWLYIYNEVHSPSWSGESCVWYGPSITPNQLLHNELLLIWHTASMSISVVDITVQHNNSWHTTRVSVHSFPSMLLLYFLCIDRAKASPSTASFMSWYQLQQIYAQFLYDIWWSPHQLWAFWQSQELCTSCFLPTFNTSF